MPGCLLGYWVEYDNHFYYLSGMPVIASCITGISDTSDRAIYGGHERHVDGDAPKVPALSAIGVPTALTAFMGQALAKPDKA
ncbi:hypothetical protein SAMN05421686_1072 [Thalassolituus maritimus]|uniref:Uncharacterized protein n=1 Tax=Thalassolituus maritimus TaxID=484498 RepID=A0A1N7NGI9_9GAMM|nr:hypothetical protein [Thalassolituus maritimus]SIS97436.1 hypothetical protein SAMN05421686_1072 [Thalassolituus maritimus]